MRMASSPAPEVASPNPRESLCAELDMALNIMCFATAATDPELAQYVHAKASESYRRLAKLSAQSPGETMPERHALLALERRIQEFQRR